ncbi:hypothetical protein C8R43DRAFT_72510 [Mycena crocata]|nr:hypothetical protein C8R43DRAFT_72510 [Mycena crocata]
MCSQNLCVYDAPRTMVGASILFLIRIRTLTNSSAVVARTRTRMTVRGLRCIRIILVLSAVPANEVQYVGSPLRFFNYYAGRSLRFYGYGGEQLRHCRKTRNQTCMQSRIHGMEVCGQLCLYPNAALVHERGQTTSDGAQIYGHGGMPVLLNISKSSSNLALEDRQAYRGSRDSC